MDSLEVFSRSEHPKKQIDALIELVKQRALHRAAREPLFETGVQRLAAVGASADSADRLIAIAALCRIGLTIKSWSGRMKDLLLPTLTRPLPQLAQISDPDERLYAANIWRFANAEWLPTYLGSCAAREEGSDRVRTECIQGLVHLTGDLAQALETLRGELGRVWFDTHKPGDSMGRRLKRLLESLRVAFAAEAPDPSPEAGEVLGRLVAESIERAGRPTELEITIGLAEETVGLLHDLVRSRFSLATEPRTYASLKAVRSWFSEREWLDFVSKSSATKAARRDLAEALTLLVRAGVSDNALYESLTLAAGSSEEAREIGRSISARFPGISDQLRRWLLGSPAVRRSSLAAESQEASLDESIADLLIDTGRLCEFAAAVRRDYLGEVSIIAPRLSGPITQLLDLIDAASGIASLLAKKRGLDINGKVGEIVEFSPLEHEVGADILPGVRKVRILRPSVEALGSTGLRRLIRKALVEPQP